MFVIYKLLAKWHGSLKRYSMASNNLYTNGIEKITGIMAYLGIIQTKSDLGCYTSEGVMIATNINDWLLIAEN
jgi:hypothetical protein